MKRVLVIATAFSVLGVLYGCTGYESPTDAKVTGEREGRDWYGVEGWVKDSVGNPVGYRYVYMTCETCDPERALFNFQNLTNEEGYWAIEVGEPFGTYHDGHMFVAWTEYGETIFRYFAPDPPKEPLVVEYY